MKPRAWYKSKSKRDEVVFLAGIDPANILVFDTETTGFAAGTG